MCDTTKGFKGTNGEGREGQKGEKGEKGETEGAQEGDGAAVEALRAVFYGSMGVRALKRALGGRGVRAL